VQSFQFAIENSIPCTAHAGEAKGPESVWETLQHFHPSRIGHGVRSAEDEKLLDFLKNKNIHLEVCPTSNIQTNIYETIGQHAADKIYRHGVSMSINTDARTVTPTTLSREYSILEETFNWNKEHYLKCSMEAVTHCFAGNQLKEELRSKIRTAYELL